MELHHPDLRQRDRQHMEADDEPDPWTGIYIHHQRDRPWFRGIQRVRRAEHHDIHDIPDKGQQDIHTRRSRVLYRARDCAAARELYVIFCQDKAVAELVVKAYGKGHDDIKILEKINLNGAGARGLAKSRIVLSDEARAEVKGETYGNAPNARGHVDCIELVNGTEAVARAIPIVSVTNEMAKVTHEAAIGSVDRRQVETLMARGLDENEAVDIIVKGILR